MLYCAHNLREDKHLVVLANSMEEAGNIACDYWVDESVVVMSLEQYVKEHNGIVEIE